ncbi:MAG TPA: hypothetical protein VN829_23470 [Dongiaceae bacterium]|nr:hypothetical protein [Dongiaceae bacterium]
MNRSTALLSINLSCFFAGLLMFDLAVPCGAAVGGSLPEAAAVMKRVVQRAEQVARGAEEGKYVYEKRSVVEELDDAGKARKTTEKTYKVALIRGLPLARLTKVQNRDLTEEEIRAEDRKEQELRNRVTGKDPQQMVKKKENWLTPELVGRYDYKVEGRESVENRPMLVLSFQPKAGHNPDETIPDRVLRRLAGRLWVDEAEAEVARVQAGLTEDLSLGWFGLIGSLKQCDLDLQKKRLEDGGWVNAKQTLEIRGRKLFSRMRVRTLEESYNFKRP